jgi:ferredoxin
LALSYKNIRPDAPMKIPVVDMAECILCEICVELAPHGFQINDAGFVEVLPLDDYSDDDIHEAIKNCPKDCIGWE